MTYLPSTTVTEALGSAPDVVAELLGENAMFKCLRRAGLPESLSFHVGHYIPEIAIDRFFDAAAECAGDDLFALNFVERLSVREYGVWGDYVLEAATLELALHRAVSVIHLHAQLDTLVVSKGETTTLFEYGFAEKSGPGYRQIAIAALGPLLSIPRHFCGSNWKPVSIGLDLGERQSEEAIENRLGTKVRTDRQCISIEIPNSDLSTDNPTKPNQWTTREDVERACSGGPPMRLVPFVEDLIIQRLGVGAVGLEDIAFILASSRRTLQRQFEQEGTDFRSIALSAKMRCARELLACREKTVAEVAGRLGYSTSSHFARAFRKSHNVTPQEYRNANLRAL